MDWLSCSKARLYLQLTSRIALRDFSTLKFEMKTHRFNKLQIAKRGGHAIGEGGCAVL